MVNPRWQAPVWCEEFLFEQIFGAGLADTSVRTLCCELNAWERWLRARKCSWRRVTPADLREWLRHIEPLAPATVEKKTWALRSLYRWAVAQKLVLTDPWMVIARPVRRVPWTPRYTPSERVVNLLIEQPDVSTFRGIRDRAILDFLYSTGLRARELLNLEWHQVRLTSGERAIRVMGKGRKERIVVYGEVAAFWLDLYVRHARPALLHAAGPISQFWVNDTKAGVLRYGVLYRMVKRYATSIGYPMITPHVLRHAFATHLYENGANLRVIQMLLGHSNLATTCIYAKPSARHLREVLERHHPRFRTPQPAHGRAKPTRAVDYSTRAFAQARSSVPEPERGEHGAKAH